MHGFLSVRNDGGTLIGYADELNVPVGRAWRSRLTVRFLDGSLSDETTVYTQGKALHLLSDHLVQRGPSFPKPTDMTIDTAKGQVTYHARKDGKDVLNTDSMAMPEDLYNGMIPAVLENVPPGADEFKISYIVMAPKPRMVRFAIHPEGQTNYRVGTTRRANHYRIHVEIGGIAGVIAPVIGKEPPDMDAWVTSGEAPTLLKLRGFLFDGGPLWMLQLFSPRW